MKKSVYFGLILVVLGALLVLLGGLQRSDILLLDGKEPVIPPIFEFYHTYPYHLIFWCMIAIGIILIVIGRKLGF